MSDSWFDYPSVHRTGGPERIYDSEAAKEPAPPKGPFGFGPTLTTLNGLVVDVVQRDPDQPLDWFPQPLLWEGDQA